MARSDLLAGPAPRALGLVALLLSGAAFRAALGDVVLATVHNDANCADVPFIGYATPVEDCNVIPLGCNPNGDSFLNYVCVGSAAYIPQTSLYHPHVYTHMFDGDTCAPDATVLGSEFTMAGVCHQSLTDEPEWTIATCNGSHAVVYEQCNSECDDCASKVVYDIGKCQEIDYGGTASSNIVYCSNCRITAFTSQYHHVGADGGDLADGLVSQTKDCYAVGPVGLMGGYTVTYSGTEVRPRRDRHAAQRARALINAE